MKSIRFLFALTATFILGGALASTMGINPAIGAGGVGVSSLFINQTGVAFAGLNKEIWLDEIKEDFYADDMWISELVNMDEHVENDIINLAAAGVAPEVLINNTTYPIPAADRNDTPIAIELDRFDTENTTVKYADRVELIYSKLQSVMFGHKQALKMTFMEKGAHSVAPASDSEYTPLITGTGADNGDGYKRIKYADILKMQKRFDNAEVPAEGRIMILSAQHHEDLEIEDVERYNRVMEKGELASFKIYKQAEKRLPMYDTATGVKVAFGATPAATAVHASIFLSKWEVGRANGTDQMFHQKAEDNPTTREDMIGFARRGIIIPIRNKGIGAIYSAAV